MTAPDRIWAWVYADPWGNELRWFEWDDHKPDDGDTEYIRHDAAAIAASPVVQDLIRQAVKAEREACAKRAEACCTDVLFESNPAKLYKSAAAAIRARGEG